MTKGSVRTLVQTVEESNGAEACRLMHIRYAPDTQNRQFLMQKIMMLAKLWCDHAEGFESGLRAWELDVGERERASGTTLADAVKYTVMMDMAPIQCLPQGHKLVQSVCFLTRGAQLHACPIKYPGQKVPLFDPGIRTACGARLQHDGGRLVTYKLPGALE